MQFEKCCNFNVILNVFLENKNITHGINHKLYYAISGWSVDKIKNYLLFWTSNFYATVFVLLDEFPPQTIKIC